MISNAIENVIEAFWKIIISLVAGIFKLVNSAYRIFLVLAKATIFNNEDFNIITKNMYEILSIVMLFALAYGILVKIVDPENSKSGIDGKKILQKFVVAIVLLALVPSIFSFMFGLQEAVLESNVLNSIFTGTNSNGAESIENAGISMAVNSFIPFFTPNVDNDANPEDARKEIRNKSEYAIILNNESYGCKEDECTLEDVDNFALNTGNFGFYQAFALNIHEGDIDFQWLIALIVGGFLVYAMVSFCFDMALRICKLAFFEIIAPIAIFCNVIPKMEDVFKKWLSNTTKTFIAVFTRIIVMNFGVYLISIICSDRINLGLENTGNWFLNLIAKCFLILGIVMFMRQAPKLLSDLFGFGDGDMKLGIKDKLKEGGFFAAGNAVGSLVTSRGNPLAFIRGAKYGFKNDNMHNIGAEATRRRQFRHTLENSSLGDIAMDKLRRTFGFETSKEAADLHIENATLTIKDADGNDIKLDPKAIEKLQKNKDDLNAQVSQITDMMRKRQTAKSDNGILIASQDAVKNAAISDLSKADSKIMESELVYSDTTLKELDDLERNKGNMSETEYNTKLAAIKANGASTATKLSGNYTSLKEQLDSMYKRGEISNYQYQKASIAVAEKQKEMVKKYVDAVANKTGYQDVNGILHEVDKSKKVLSAYEKFNKDLESGRVARNNNGELFTKEEIEQLGLGLDKGWDYIDGISKKLGGVNYELDAALMDNEREKRIIEQDIQAIDGQLDQVAKLKQQAKSSDSYKSKSSASEYNEKYKK